MLLIISGKKMGLIAVVLKHIGKGAQTMPENGKEFFMNFEKDGRADSSDPFFSTLDDHLLSAFDVNFQKNWPRVNGPVPH